MPISNYPFGWANGVAIRGLPVLNTYGGLAKVVFVDSNAGNDNNPGTPLLPCKTVAGGIKVLQNTPGHGSGKKGDIIALNPYHAETLSAATTYSLQDVAIIGLSDAEDDMPTFTLTTAAGAGITLGSAGMMLNNVKLIDNQGVTIAVTLAAKGQVVDNCKIIDGSASFTTGISIVGGSSNAADRCRVINNIIRSGGATQAILANEIDDQVEISGNDILGSFSTAAIQSTAAITNARIRANNILNTSASGKGANQTSASATGLVSDNRITTAVQGNELVLSAAGMVGPGNLGSNPNAQAPYNLPIGTADETIALVSAIKALPQTTTSTVFTVTGGPVRIIELSAEVTTAIQNQANSTKFTFTDTVSSTATDICAVASIANAAAGTFLWVKGDAAATALQVTAGGVTFGRAANTIQVPAGSCVVNCAASNTGNVKYRLVYQPMAPGAYVTMS